SSSAWPLLAAWAGFGLFTIGSSAAIALHADRLAHRQRQAVLTNYFEHIMQLPLTFHTGTHSGRLMKVMLNGTDSLWRLWLGFFREHFAAIMSLVVLLPLALYVNWRLAILLFGLCVVFTALTTLVVRKTYGMQNEVEAHYSDLSARASDALGNVALVQSFVRIQAEVQGLRFVADKLLAVADLSFTALPGETVALVGPTGASKSTAIALLHRAFDPQSGIIKIDGMDVRGLTLTALRRNIGVVFQEALLFNRSIADNLRVGKPDATDEELRIAAARAQALEFIERSERGFDTNAGERGRMLSGGERQRLSIARAL